MGLFPNRAPQKRPDCLPHLPLSHFPQPPGGRFTPMHTTIVPDISTFVKRGVQENADISALTRKGLQENMNPAMNAQPHSGGAGLGVMKGLGGSMDARISIHSLRRHLVCMSIFSRFCVELILLTFFLNKKETDTARSLHNSTCTSKPNRRITICCCRRQQYRTRG